MFFFVSLLTEFKTVFLNFIQLILTNSYSGVLAVS